MDSLHTITEIAERVRHASDMPALNSELERITDALKFDFYVVAPENHCAGTLTNLPHLWELSPPDGGCWRALGAACTNYTSGFVWSDLPRDPAYFADDQHLLCAASKHGIGDAYTLPAEFADGAKASVSLAKKVGRGISPDEVPRAHLVSARIHEARRRLQKSASEERPQLTARQIECVTLIAKGKTDWEAGTLLGVSKETVHKHIQAAMRRFGVNCRMQLVVRALINDYISIAELDL